MTIDENTGFGWILKENPNFWEDNGFRKIESSNYHYHGCLIAKANKHPVYSKSLYIDYDYEEEGEIRLFACESGVICNNYIVSISEWNNAGGCSFPLRCVQQAFNIKQFNELVREYFADELDNGTFLLTINKE